VPFVAVVIERSQFNREVCRIAGGNVPVEMRVQVNLSSHGLLLERRCRQMFVKKLLRKTVGAVAAVDANAHGRLGNVERVSTSFPQD
jgi:hypothetical protein